MSNEAQRNEQKDLPSDHCSLLSAKFTDQCSLLTELLFPKICLVCQEESIQAYDTPLCASCLEKLPKRPRSNCSLCGGHNDTILSNCQECLDASHPWKQGKTLLPYKSTHRKAIHLFKYSKKLQYGLYFSQKILEEYKSYIESNDLITYVPLHWSKKIYRGFNQAEYLAQNIADGSKITCSKLLKRKKWTGSQTKLNREQRLVNNLAVFELINKDKIKDKTILLIDDVMTTGATLHACACKLLEAGAVDIKILTVARG